MDRRILVANHTDGHSISATVFPVFALKKQELEIFCNSLRTENAIPSQTRTIDDVIAKVKYNFVVIEGSKEVMDCSTSKNFHIVYDGETSASDEVIVPIDARNPENSLRKLENHRRPSEPLLSTEQKARLNLVVGITSKQS